MPLSGSPPSTPDDDDRPRYPDPGTAAGTGERVATSASEQEPVGVQDLGLRARHLAQMGEVDAAIEAYLAAGADAYFRLDLPAALDRYDEANRLMPDEDDTYRKRSCLREMVRCLRLMGQIEPAKRLALEVIERSMAAGDPVFATSCQVVLGFLYCDNGEIDQSIDLLYSVLLGDPAAIPTGDLSTISNTLAYAFYLKGQYTESIEHGERAVLMSRQTGTPRGEAEGLSMTANSYVDVGLYRDAIEMYQGAGTIQRQIQDPRGVAVSELNIGYCHARLGEERPAREALDRAMAIAEAHDGRRTQSFAHHYQGVLGEVLGQMDEAANAYRLAWESRSATGQWALAMESLGAMGRIRFRAALPGTLPASIERVARWLEASGPEGMEDFASAYVTCVSLLVAAAQPDRARALLADGQAHLVRRASLIRDDAMRRSYLGIASNHTLRLTRVR